jgi:hypothetical protein
MGDYPVSQRRECPAHFPEGRIQRNVFLHGRMQSGVDADRNDVGGLRCGSECDARRSAVAIPNPGSLCHPCKVDRSVENPQSSEPV